jgi:hypothetical protein
MLIGALLHNAKDGRLHPVFLTPSQAPEGSVTVHGHVRYSILDVEETGSDVYADGFRRMLEISSDRGCKFITQCWRWDGETQPALAVWFDLENDLSFKVTESAGILLDAYSRDWKQNVAVIPYDRKLRLELEAAVAGQEFKDETARHLAMAHHAVRNSKVSAGWMGKAIGLDIYEFKDLCMSYGHDEPFEY